MKKIIPRAISFFCMQLLLSSSPAMPFVLHAPQTATLSPRALISADIFRRKYEWQAEDRSTIENPGDIESLIKSAMNDRDTQQSKDAIEKLIELWEETQNREIIRQLSLSLASEGGVIETKKTLARAIIPTLASVYAETKASVVINLLKCACSLGPQDITRSALLALDECYLESKDQDILKRVVWTTFRSDQQINEQITARFFFERKRRFIKEYLGGENTLFVSEFPWVIRFGDTPIKEDLLADFRRLYGEKKDKELIKSLVSITIVFPGEENTHDGVMNTLGDIREKVKMYRDGAYDGGLPLIDELSNRIETIMLTVEMLQGINNINLEDDFIKDELKVVQWRDRVGKVRKELARILSPLAEEKYLSLPPTASVEEENIARSI